MVDVSQSICEPVPGYWYAGITGPLQQVRIILYASGLAHRLVIESIAGEVKIIRMDDWDQMGLMLRSPGMNRRGRQRCNQDESLQKQF